MGDARVCIGLAVCFGVGSAIFFSILFTCTLEDAAKIDNSVETTCHFEEFAAIPSWCCQLQNAHCDAGCSTAATTNGGCDAWLSNRRGLHSDMSAPGIVRDFSSCCDGTCCARYLRTCDTCSRQVCTYSDSRRRRSSNSGGRRGQAVTSTGANSTRRGTSCYTQYYDCNCRDVCTRHSTKQQDVACDTCHSYNIGMTFTIDGVEHSQTHVETCGLTSSGYSDTACHTRITTEFAVGQQKQCWVDTRDMSVQFSKPGWNVGCWVGISIGSIMILVAICSVMVMSGCCRNTLECLGSTCAGLCACICNCPGAVYNFIFGCHKEQQLDLGAYQNAMEGHTRDIQALEAAVAQDLREQMIILVQIRSSGDQMKMRVHPTTTLKAVNESLSVDKFEFCGVSYTQALDKSLADIGIVAGASINVNNTPVAISGGSELRALSKNEQLLAECIANTPKQEDFFEEVSIVQCCGVTCCNSSRPDATNTKVAMTNVHKTDHATPTTDITLTKSHDSMN